MQGIFSRRFRKYFLEKKACHKPDGEIVQTDDSLVMKGRVAVIPGTHMEIFENASAGKFRKINAGSIEKTPDSNGKSSDFLVNRRNEGGAAINRKHKEGAFAHHGGFSGKKGMASGPENFQAPAQGTAQEKIMFHSENSFGFY